MIKRGEKRGTHALTSVINNLKICPKSKRSQVTIFIIIAVIIIAVALLIYFIYPKIKTTGITTDPTSYIQDCIKKDLETNINKISMQGGSLNPTLYSEYNNEKIEYLCYINEYYKTCVMQQPLLKTHIEEEIKNSINEKTKECFDSLEETYKKRGYEVNLIRNDHQVELLPERIITTFDYYLELTKGSATNKYEVFKIVLNNNLYELVSISNSILRSEAQYGDTETTNYMTYYHWLKLEKKGVGDGTKVYILTDRNSQNKFQFASRSIVWPAGYGF